MASTRNRTDRCPGVLRPWSADDGLLVRLRLIGGRVGSSALTALADVATTYGDGRVRLTGRANLQLRGLPGVDGRLDDDAIAALEATGLLPTRTHELVRNVMVSPQTGLAGGRADLRPVADELDRLLCADPGLAELPGRFLFVLDDGRGDLVDRGCDLGLVALDADTAQLRVGGGWGPVVPLEAAAAEIVVLAGDFLDRRGSGPTAPWHVWELDEPLLPPSIEDPRIPVAQDPLAYGDVAGGEHVDAVSGLDRAAVAALTASAPELVVTPWRGVLVPEESHA
ncbi:nitrite reductase [Nocardioides sp. CN2-186]|uniref:nitrite reductase n=1 Tax=Nocardioides tweenelious TaxID=3156607 RepID=UPI0032B39F1E